MQVTNDSFTKIQELNIPQDDLPQISDTIANIYHQHVKAWNKPENANLNMKNQFYRIDQLSKAIEKKAKKSTFHKIMSLSLLAISVTLIASGILLACFTPPAFLPLATLLPLVGGAFVAELPALCLCDSLKHAIGQGVPAAFPPFATISYVYDAFSGWKQKKMEEENEQQIKQLEMQIVSLQTLTENCNEEEIQEQLNPLCELAKDAEQDVGKQITQYQEALNQLKKANRLLKKLNEPNS